MVDLRVELAGIKLLNPTVLASGILGDNAALLRRAAEAGFGAVTTKSFTIEPREGYKTPIVAEVKVGLLNAVGLANPGYRELKTILPRAKVDGVPIIVSLAGSKIDEFVEMAIYAEDWGADIIELNLSCPHVSMMGMEIGHDPDFVAKLVGELTGVIETPVFIKIGLTDNYMEVVSRALDKGAAGITAINTVRAMAIDIYAKTPILSHGYGGLSGPAIHPIATRVIYDIYREFKPPVIGIGGVETWEDAVEFLLAGATAIGIGTAVSKYGLSISTVVSTGIRSYLEREGFKSVRDIIGYVHGK